MAGRAECATEFFGRLAHKPLRNSSQRLRETLGLQPVEYPSTRDLYAGVEQKAEDLETAFADPEIKAVIATIGGDIQVTYVANLKRGVFVDNPKLFSVTATIHIWRTFFFCLASHHSTEPLC